GWPTLTRRRPSAPSAACPMPAAPGRWSRPRSTGRPARRRSTAGPARTPTAVRVRIRARPLHHFDRIDGALHAEGVPLEALAEAVGTPFYAYSTATLTRHYGLLREAVETHRASLGDALIAFAVKANSNLSVLATLARMGSGADTVSEGEIRRALKAGVPAGRIVFSGVGKSDAELAFAIEAGVRQINVESAVELERLIGISADVGAADRGAAPQIAIRVNPKIGAGGHARITTGGAADKFGVPAEEAPALYARAAASPHVTPVGLACHIGSQITM